MSQRLRLDRALVERKLAESRTKAKEMIEAGSVTVGGAPALNPARMVSSAEPINVVGPRAKFVSRGGLKLEKALEYFSIDPRDSYCLDVGASTGGFTDVLLQNGARRVVAMDVGFGHLHEKIRTDSRVEVFERLNFRTVEPGFFGPELFDLVVCDVSFISLGAIAENLTGGLSRDGSKLVTLIKPQFEAGRQEVSKGKGVIRSPEIWQRTIEHVLANMADHGATNLGVVKSPISGTSGNIEFLAAFELHTEPAHAKNALSEIDIASVCVIDVDDREGSDGANADSNAIETTHGGTE